MNIERLVVPISWKASDDGDHILEGYASTFGNVDLGGDVVAPGAFDKTIANIKANGIPLLADHVPQVNSVLGTIFDAKADDTGLQIRARFSSAASAQDAYTKAKEGHVNRMSIGYEAMDYSFEDLADGRRVRVLKEVKLWESSVVVFPMNPEAVISRVKSIVQTVADAPQRATLAAELKSHLDDLAELNVDLPEVARKTSPAGVPGAEASPDEGEGIGTPDEGAAEAVNPTADAGDEPAPSPDEGEKGWDHYVSEAILAGRDPEALVDAAKRAALTTRLELLEVDPDLGPLVSTDKE
jgi:HK97 family phage prohead protease